MDNILFIWGNSVRDFTNGDAGKDELNKYYLDIIYGNVSLEKIPNDKLKKYYNDRIDRIKHCSHKVDPEEVKVIMKRVQDMGSGGWERRGRRDLRSRALLTAPAAAFLPMLLM